MVNFGASKLGVRGARAPRAPLDPHLLCIIQHQFHKYNGSKSNKQVGVYIVAFIVYCRYVGCRYLETTISPFENESVGEYKSSEA